MSTPKPTLHQLEPDQLPKRIAQDWQDSMNLRGDATFFAVFANHPELYDWYIDRFYGELFYSGQVDRRSKEILRLRLSAKHGCRFCNQGNRPAAADAGLSDEEIDSIMFDDGDRLNEQDMAILTLADQMLLDNLSGSLDKQLHQQLSPHFSDAQILELGVVAAVLTGMAKMLFVYDLVEKQANCPCA